MDGKSDDDSSFSTAKDRARDSRLQSMKKTEEERHLRAFQDQVKNICIETFHDLGKCTTANGLMMVFNCRKENKAMNDCLNTHFSDDLFKKYLADRGLPPPKPPKTIVDEFQKLFSK